MAQSEYLCLERRLRAKPPEEHPPDQAEQVPHRAFIARFGRSRQADGICGSHTMAEPSEPARAQASEKPLWATSPPFRRHCHTVRDTNVTLWAVVVTVPAASAV